MLAADVNTGCSQVDFSGISSPSLSFLSPSRPPSPVHLFEVKSTHNVTLVSCAGISFSKQLQPQVYLASLGPGI